MRAIQSPAVPLNGFVNVSIASPNPCAQSSRICIASLSKRPLYSSMLLLPKASHNQKFKTQNSMFKPQPKTQNTKLNVQATTKNSKHKTQCSSHNQKLKTQKLNVQATTKNSKHKTQCSSHNVRSEDWTMFRNGLGNAWGPEEFGVGGLGEDFFDGLADFADGAPAALEAVDPGLAGVEEAALDAIAEAFVLAGGGRDALLLLLEGQVEELARFALHSVGDGGGDAVVDDLDEAPLGERLDEQLGGGLALQGERGEVHGGQLLRHVEVVVGHLRPLVLRPDELRQVGAGAAQQVRLPRLRQQARVGVAPPPLQGAIPEMAALVHQRLVVRRVKRLRNRHRDDRFSLSLSRSINQTLVTNPQHHNHHYLEASLPTTTTTRLCCNDMAPNSLKCSSYSQSPNSHQPQPLPSSDINPTEAPNRIHPK
jgi:hypothetical protein